MSQDWQTVINLAMSAAMIIFGVGSWSAQRKSGESMNAADISKLVLAVGEVKSALETKVGWKDFDRSMAGERRATDLQVKAVEDRMDRIEKKVFNGDRRG